MAFRVEVQPRAYADLDAVTGYIELSGGFEMARRWFSGMMDAIYTLRELPERCAIAEESGGLGKEVRLLLHGRRNRLYKIYFEVISDGHSSGVVPILHVRHWAKRELRQDELQELLDDSQEE